MYTPPTHFVRRGRLGGSERRLPHARRATQGDEHTRIYGRVH
ncbi:hypothetical protein [Haloplanus halobius]|nr:hypothetical protein [Haloplanus sp. XH21]